MLGDCIPAGFARIEDKEDEIGKGGKCGDGLLFDFVSFFKGSIEKPGCVDELVGDFLMVCGGMKMADMYFFCGKGVGCDLGFCVAELGEH